MADSVYLAAHEIRRYARRGLAEGAAAIKAVSVERKPGKIDSRDNEERLTDLLCSLRIWAGANAVAFDTALAASLTHHLIETGRLAENWIDL